MNRLKKIYAIFIGIVFAIMLLVGITVIVLTMLGYRIFVVKTPSMQKEYPVNSIVLVDHSKPESIKEGDVVSFVADKKLNVVTHRVVEVHNEAKEPYFVTKGDSNIASDKRHVLYENVIGKVVCGIPYLGKLVGLLAKKPVRYFLVVLLGVVAATLVYSCVKFVRSFRKGTRNEEKHSENV